VPNKFSRRRVLKVGVGFMLGAGGATLFSDCSTVLAQSEFMTGILWHNSSTGEIQIWLMDGYKLKGRRTVLGEDEKPAFVGPPWSIVGVGPFSGKNGILWHNSSTGEIQIWLMDGYKLKDRRTVLGEDEKPAFVGPPWGIVGISSFSRDRRLPRPGDPH
jgi:hypothetical protein